MHIDETKPRSLGFDLTDLPYEAGRPIHLCALTIGANKEGILCVPNVKNIACVSESSVKAFMPSSKFKYTAIFDNIVVKASADADKDPYLAKASIENLKPFLPQNIDLDINKDLLAVCFNAFVVNRGNKNGHIIGSDIALAMLPNFVNKFLNLEHDRKTIVGFITGYGFSEFGTDRPLTPEEVIGSIKPYNVVLSGFVWKTANPEFSQILIDSNDPSSSDYMAVSTSWELGFNEFNIAAGSNDLETATIIDSEEALLSLKDRLQVFGGTGRDENGNLILLNLQGAVLPLGMSFTATPAAEVKGVKVADSNSEINTAPAILINKNASEEDNLENKSVPTNVADVKPTMTIKNVEDITDESIKEVKASAIREFISEQIGEHAKNWKTQVEEKDAAIKAAQELAETAKTDLEAIKAENEKTALALAELQESVRKTEIEAAFQRRMSVVSEGFNLTDEDSEIVAEDLRTLDTDEAFDKWFKKFSSLASGKKKDAANKKDDDKKDDKSDKNDNDEDDAKAKKVKADEELESAKKAKADEDLESSKKKKDEEDAKAAIEARAKAEGKTVEEIVASVEAEKLALANAGNSQTLNLSQKLSAAFNTKSVKFIK